MKKIPHTLGNLQQKGTKLMKLFWRAELQRRRARGNSLLHGRHFDQPEKPSDAVLEMDDQIVFVELAKINLRAIASFPATQTSSAVDGKAPQ